MDETNAERGERAASRAAILMILMNYRNQIETMFHRILALEFAALPEKQRATLRIKKHGKLVSEREVSIDYDCPSASELNNIYEAVASLLDEASTAEIGEINVQVSFTADSHT